MRRLPNFAPWMTDRLAARLPMVEESLRAAFDLPADPALPLYKMMRYHLGWVDALGEERPGPGAPRFLGALCVEAASGQISDAPVWAPEGAAEAAEAQRQAAERSRDCAAAIELLAASIAVHEDIQTAAQTRNGQDAVWWTWGPAQAINAGDALHALARLVILQMPTDDPADASLVLAALAELDNAALAYCDGQIQDLQMQERVDVTERQYLAMARAKHGALPGAALALGALAGGADEATAAKWRDAGVAAGTAAAMAKDYREIWAKGEAAQPNRALSKSKLHPVVVGFQLANLAQKRELAACYFKRVMEPADLERVRAILEDIGVLPAIRDAMDVEGRNSIKALERTELTILAIDTWVYAFNGLAGESPK